MITKTTLIVLLLLLSPTLVCENNGTIKLLVLTNQTSNARIEFYTDDELVGKSVGIGVGGAFGLIGLGIGAGVSSSASSSRNKSYSSQLNALIDSKQEKKQAIFENNLNDIFNRWHNVFEIDVPNSQDLQKYYSKDTGFNRKAILKDGYNYYLTIKQDLLYLTTAQNPGELIPDFRFDLELHKSNARKNLSIKDKRVRLKDFRKLEEVLDNTDLFFDDYSESVNEMGIHLYKQLEKNDYLNAISEAYGMSHLFPSIGELRSKYSKRFSYIASIPDGWKYRKSKDKYTHELYPENNNRVMTIKTSIELEGLTQLYDSSNMTDFVGYFFREQLDQGWEVSDLQGSDIPGLSDEWSAVSLASPAVGKILFACKSIDKDFIVTHSVKILADNTDLFLSHYKQDIAAYINGSSFVLTGK
jgi:hypothetical protein